MSIDSEAHLSSTLPNMPSASNISSSNNTNTNNDSRTNIDTRVNTANNTNNNESRANNNFNNNNNDTNTIANITTTDVDKKQDDPDDDDSLLSNHPRKRSKVSRACDCCRRKKIRCDAEYSSTLQKVTKICTNCSKNSEACLFSRIPLKRGPTKGYIKDLEDKLEITSSVKPRARSFSDHHLLHLPAAPQHHHQQQQQQHQQQQLQHHQQQPVVDHHHRLSAPGNIPAFPLNHPTSTSQPQHNLKPPGNLPFSNSSTVPTPIHRGSVSSTGSSSHNPSSSSPNTSARSPIILPPLIGNYTLHQQPQDPQGSPNSKPFPKLGIIPSSIKQSMTSNPSSPHNLAPFNNDSTSAAGVSPLDSEKQPLTKTSSPPIQGPFWKVPYEMPGSKASSGADGSSNSGSSSSLSLSKGLPFAGGHLNSNHGSISNTRRSSLDSVSSTSTTATHSRLPSLKPSISVVSDNAVSDSDDDFYSVKSSSHRNSTQSLSPRNSISSLTSLSGRMNKNLNLNNDKQPQHYDYPGVSPVVAPSVPAAAPPPATAALPPQSFHQFASSHGSTPYHGAYHHPSPFPQAQPYGYQYPVGQPFQSGPPTQQPHQQPPQQPPQQPQLQLQQQLQPQLQSHPQPHHLHVTPLQQFHQVQPQAPVHIYGSTQPAPQVKSDHASGTPGPQQQSPANTLLKPGSAFNSRLPFNSIEHNLKIYYERFHPNFPILPYNQEFMSRVFESCTFGENKSPVSELFHLALNNLNFYQYQNIQDSIQLFHQVLKLYPFNQFGITLNDNVLMLFFSSLVLLNYSILLNGDIYSLGFPLTVSILNDFKVLENFNDLVKDKSQQPQQPADYDNIKLFLPKLYYCMFIIDHSYSLAFGIQPFIHDQFQLLYENLESYLCPLQLTANCEQGYFNFKIATIFHDSISSRNGTIFKGTFTKRLSTDWNQVLNIKSNKGTSIFNAGSFSQYFVTLIKEKYELVDYLTEINALLNAHNLQNADDEDESLETIHDYQLKLSRLLKKVSQSIITLANHISTISSQKKNGGEQLISPFLNISIGQSYKLVKLCKLIIDSIINHMNDSELINRSIKINNDLSIAFNLLTSTLNNNTTTNNEFLNDSSNSASPRSNLPDDKMSVDDNIRLDFHAKVLTPSPTDVNNCGLGSMSINLIKSKVEVYNLSFGDVANAGKRSANRKSSPKARYIAWKDEFVGLIVPFVKREDIDGWY